MRRFGLAALALLLMVGVVGWVAYDLGVSAGAADAAIAAGASVVYAPATISPLGIIVGGFFLLLLIGFIARAIAGPRMPMGPGPWGRHGRGRGEWDHEHVPERFRPMLERWHHDAHGGAGRGGEGAGQTSA